MTQETTSRKIETVYASHADRLRAGVTAWNAWRQRHPEVKADLRGADLRGADLRGADLAGADLSEADLLGADLSGADLPGATLAGADLRDADLREVDLRRAHLSGATLRGAILRGAHLRGATLRGADLCGAALSGADLRKATGLPPAPTVKAIDRHILAAVQADGGAMPMDTWHTCETQHCRAGWAITLAGEAGRSLEDTLGSCAAGALIYAASRPDKPVPDFYATDADALADLDRCANEEVTS